MLFYDAAMKDSSRHATVSFSFLFDSVSATMRAGKKENCRRTIVEFRIVVFTIDGIQESVAINKISFIFNSVTSLLQFIDFQLFIYVTIITIQATSIFLYAR